MRFAVEGRRLATANWAGSLGRDWQPSFSPDGREIAWNHNGALWLMQADGNVIGRAIRTPQHRLVEWKKPGAAADTADLELYDYAADPGETRNIANAQPEVVAKLRALLASHGEAKPPIPAR